MKTLQQIEPRVDLQSSTPAAGVDTANADYHYVINQPGSYYLSANLAVTKKSGILINAPDVTLELNGFEVSRATGSAGVAIQVAATAHRASISHGTVSGFDKGINAGDTAAVGCVVRNVRASNCTTFGISGGISAIIENCHASNCQFAIGASDGSTIANCTAANNTFEGISAGNAATITGCTVTGTQAQGLAGIHAGSNCLLRGCSAYANNSTHGILALDRCTLIHCVASSNSSAGSLDGIQVGQDGLVIGCDASSNRSSAATKSASTGVGIVAQSGTQIKDCTASGNTVEGISGGSLISNCTANGNGFNSTFGIGIDAASGSRVENCRVKDNMTHGISVSSNSYIVENNCVNNGSGAGVNGSGIHVTGSENRIEANNTTDNYYGMKVDAAGNLIVRNSNKGGSFTFSFANGNSAGEIINVWNNGAGATITTSNSWANFAY